MNLLREAPALRLRLSIWDILGTVAYVLSFALIESGLFLVLILVLAALLPASWLRARLATQGSAVAIISAGWAIATQYSAEPIASWGWVRALLWVVLYVIAVAGALRLIRRRPAIEQALSSFVAGLVVLAAFYAVISIIGLVIVLLRNI